MSRFVSLNEAVPPLDLGFAHFPLDRAEHHRGDEAYLASARATGRTYAVVGDSVVLAKGDGPEGALDPLFDAARLPLKDQQRETVFLGLTEAGEARFCTLYDDAAAEALAGTAGLTTIGLRQCAVDDLLPIGDLGALAAGKALLYWHANHRFCSKCGAPSVLAHAGFRRDCTACKAPHFPRTDPVVIMLAVDGERCLMGRQPRFVPGMYSCLAGFCEPGETIEAAVRREVFEEAGIRTGRVRYLASQPWPFPESLMIGCIAEATSTDIVRDETELEDVRWFTRDEVRQMIAKAHPDNVWVPAKFSLASQLVRAWALDGVEI